MVGGLMVGGHCIISHEAWAVLKDFCLTTCVEASVPLRGQAVAEDVTKSVVQTLCYGGGRPQGYIFRTREHIVQTSIARPGLYYFGRTNGKRFEDYKIAKGDPSPEEMAEVIGGLFRTLDNYNVSHGL
jgi:hypothetical protein